ncbi:MAG: NAD(P)/FAD-dependent oxidoreductase [Phycisphaerales bacterium]
MEERRYDVVIIGGAFSGSAAAILLRRLRPECRVLVVERKAEFDEKVGEATTEMSAMFLTRRLGLWEHLEREHLPKEGLRYWFVNDRVSGHADAGETGGFLRSAVPAFQLRRDALDEHMLATARESGAEVLRPASVRDVQLADFDSRVTIEHAGERFVARCRWVLDASGRATFLSTRLGLFEWNDAHPIAAAWARWTDLGHIDDLAARGPAHLARGNVGSRRLATNHYMGRGHWTWVIPLGNGQTSIGVVWDKRLVDLHKSPRLRDDYREFLLANPALRELLDGASMRDEDFRSLSRAAYRSKQYMGRGWALLGDAASFIDPYYSPGLDHAAFTVEATCAILAREARGKSIEADIAEHNTAFDRSYRCFFEAVYRDKYRYMGERDLVSAAFLMETAQYYLFVVMYAYRALGRFFWMPVLAQRRAHLSFLLMRFSHRRFVRIADRRHRLGRTGANNDRRRVKVYFNLGAAPARMLAKGLGMWLRAELGNAALLIGSMFRRTTPQPAPFPHEPMAEPKALTTDQTAQTPSHAAAAR